VLHAISGDNLNTDLFQLSIPAATILSHLNSAALEHSLMSTHS